MELEQYINQEREIYDSTLKYIEAEESIEEEYRKLIDLFNKRQILEKRSEIIEALQILTSISCNHHRIPNFYSKVERVLDYFLDQLKQTFSNTELLQIFYQDKRIIYYLMTKDIFKQDETYHLLLLRNPFNFYKKDSFQRKPSINKRYDLYFYPEIKNRIRSIKFDWYDREKYDEVEKSDLTDFEKKRENGENDSHICSLIRNDSIVEFISYISKMNYSLSSSINSSIFETNSFLLTNDPTLIEYAAFYGSIQIYQYLRMNKVDLSSILWLYAIHGNNPEIIHLLEEDHIKPENDSYYNCFLESVKCHHNSVAKYIKDNFLNENDESVLEVALQYHNYEMLPSDFNNFDILFNACKFNYISIVKQF